MHVTVLTRFVGGRLCSDIVLLCPQDEILAYAAHLTVLGPTNFGRTTCARIGGDWPTGFGRPPRSISLV